MALILKQEANANVTTPPSGSGTIFLNGSDQLTVKDSAGNIATVPTFTPTGNSSVFYNDNGALGQSANFTFDDSSNTLSVLGNVAATGVKTNNLYYANGNPWDLQQPAGSNTYIQFNNNDSFGASANLTFDGDNLNTVANLNVTGNAHIVGNLTVDGNIVYVNVESLSVEDPLISLGGGANGAPLTSNNGFDRGLILHNYTSTTVDAFMGWDTSNAEFTFASNVSVANDVVTINQIGNIRANLVTGTLATQAQPNITSVGLLTGLLVGSTASQSDFPNATVVVSQDDSGQTHSENIGIIGEAVADSANANIWGIGVLGEARANGATKATGVQGGGYVTNSTDAGAAVGVRGYSIQTHSGGYNIGVLGNAMNSGLGSYAFYVQAGNIASIENTTAWDLVDDEAVAIAFNSSGKANIFAIDTTDGAEGVFTDGYLNVVGNVSAGGVKTDNLYYANGNPWDLQQPGGSNTQIQFNDADQFGGSAAFTFDKTSNLVAMLGNMSVVGNAQAGNVSATGGTFTTITGSLTTGAQPNVTSVGTLSSLGVSGNVTAGNVYANSGTIGANLLTGTLTTNAQPNVTSVGTLTGLTSNGNVTINANLFVQDALNTTSTVYASGNINSGDSMTAVGNISGGNLNTTGNVVATGAFEGNGVVATGNVSGGNITTTGLVSATGNVSGGNLTTGGVVSATGNVSGGNLTTTGQISATGNITTLANVIVGNRLYVGNNATAISILNPVIIGSATGETYVQGALINENANGSSDWVAYGDNGNTDAGWADFGFNGSNFNDANYSITKPNDGYFLVQSVNGVGLGGNLVFATGDQGANNDIVFATGGFLANNEKMRLIDAQNQLDIQMTTPATNATTGALVVAGGVGVGGNLYVDGTIYANISGSIVAPGSNTNILFNDGGNVGADSGLTYNKTTDTLTSGNISTGGTATATGNVTGGNIVTAGQVVATGNVTGDYFIGNGSQLTGIDATAIQNGTANVRTFLNSNVTISASGNANVLVVTGTGANIDGTANVSGNANVGNLGTAGLVVATGNVTGGNLVTGGVLSVTGNSNVGNLGTAGLVVATGNVTGGNLVTGGVVSATGNVTGGNLVTTGTANIGNLNVTGNVTSALLPNANVTYDLGSSTQRWKDLYLANSTIYLGNGTLSADGDTVTISNNLTTGGILDITGNANVGNLTTVGQVVATGNVTGGNLVTGGVLSVTGNANVGNLGTAGLVVATGNVTGGNITTGGVVSATGNVTGGNLTTGGVVSATGNVTGGNLNTSGNVNASIIVAGGTGMYLSAGPSGYINFFTTGGDKASISDTGNITGSNVIANSTVFAGTANVSGNVNAGNIITGGTVSATGNGTFGNVSATTFTGSLSGAATTAGTVTTAAQPNITSVGTLSTVSVSGNANVGNLGTAGLLVATGNITGGNIVTGGIVSATGNIVSSANVVTDLIVGKTTGVTITATGTNQNINLVPTGTGSVNVGNFIISNLAAPVADTDAATKKYVDDVSQGLNIHDAVAAATPTTLATITGGTITYNNGASGVGANLTTTGSFNLIDGVNVQTSGTRILVKNEANAVYNGIYTWSNATVITRATDFNSVPEVEAGDFVFVNGGTLYDNTGWVQTDSPAGIGGASDTIAFTQFSGAGTYTAGTGLTLLGSQFSITNTAVTAGAYGNGDYNATFTVNSQGQLTAAANVAITANAANLSGTTLKSTVVNSSLTSVGTLTTLSVSGNANVGNIGAAAGVFTTVTGSLTTAAQPNITSVGTLSSVTVTANVTAGNLVTGGVLSVTGNANVGNLGTGGLIVATGNITGGNLVTGGVLSVTGNANVGNLGTAGLIVATGNVTGGNIVTAGQVVATGNITGGNIIAGSGSGGSITGANSITANYFTGTLTTAAQPNITSVGTLTSLSVTGNANVGNIGAAAGVFTTVTGSLTTAAQPNITSVGTLSSLTVSGNASAGNLNTAGAVVASTLTSNVATGTAPLTVTSTTRVANLNVAYANVADLINVTAPGTGTGYVIFANATSGNIAELVSAGISSNLANNSITATTFVGALSGAATSATTAGTVTTAAQPNITSVGTLTSLAVTGNITTGNLTGANLVSANYFTGTLTTAAQPNITSVGTLSSLAVTGNANVGNLNSSGRVRAVENIIIDGGVTEGGQLVISWLGVTGLTGQGNSTWNLDSETANNFRLFSVNASGTASVAMTSYSGNNSTLFGNNLFVTSGVTASTLTSNVATGTAPFTVTSTTQVANLNVATAGVAGYVTAAAQSNITSVGTLSSLTVSGNIGAGNVTATTFTGALSGAATTAGTVTTAAQPNITSVGTLTSLSSSGNIQAPNLVANTGAFYGSGAGLTNIPGANVSGTVPLATSATSATTSGTVTTAAQPNITSTGTLTSLTVSGAANIQSTTAATSTTTGALKVAGGIGVAGNSYMSNMTVASNIAYVSPNAANTINSQMLNGGTLAWSGNAGQLFSITDSMSGNIFSVNDVSGIPMISVTDTGVINFAQSGGFVAYGVSSAVSAAGTTQGGATAITRPISIVSTVTASSADGVIMPTTTVGMRIMIINTSAATLKVYPASGGQINALGTNASFSLAAGGRLEFIAATTTQWYTLNATYA